MPLLHALSAGRRALREALASAPPPTPAGEGLAATTRALGDELAGAFGLDAATPALFVSPAPGASLASTPPRADVVVLGAGALTTRRTHRARSALVAWALAGADRVLAHAPVGSAGTHAGRIVIEGARALRTRARLSAPEAGDRLYARGGFSHAYFDDEPLLHEIARGGGAAGPRRGAFVAIHPAREGAPPPEAARPFRAELREVIALAPSAERLRLRVPPERAIALMRAEGRAARTRGPIGRARLRRAIGWVDAAFPRGGNCYRRTLLELGLDAGAAEEPLVFGLDVGRTGHVAFRHREPMAFDVVFDVEP